jgi:hypothetical protein
VGTSPVNQRAETAGWISVASKREECTQWMTGRPR